MPSLDMHDRALDGVGRVEQVTPNVMEDSLMLWEKPIQLLFELRKIEVQGRDKVLIRFQEQAGSTVQGSLIGLAKEQFVIESIAMGEMGGFFYGSSNRHAI